MRKVLEAQKPSVHGRVHPAVPAEGVMEAFSYDDAIVRKFLTATMAWGLVAFLVGIIIALELALPTLVSTLAGVQVLGLRPLAWLGNLTQFLSFGRLRPLHTNAAIFAFAGNALFAAVYYSTQRLCKARIDRKSVV